MLATLAGRTGYTRSARFLVLLPELLDFAPSDHPLGRVAILVVHTLWFSCTCKPSTTSLLRQSLPTRRSSHGLARQAMQIAEHLRTVSYSVAAENHLSFSSTCYGVLGRRSLLTTHSLRFARRLPTNSSRHTQS